jgi:hypothetical protein
MGYRHIQGKGQTMMRHKLTTNNFSHLARSQRGQALIEGAAVMILIVMLSVMCVVFVLNVGMSMYYKQKLSFAACQAAQSAVDMCTWNNAIRPGVSSTEVETYTRKRLQESLQSLGLPPADLIDIDRTDVGVTVKVKISNLQLIKSGFLPSFVSLEESSSYLFAVNEPPAVLTIRGGDPTAMEGNNMSVQIPVYGRFSLRTSAPDMRQRFGVHNVPAGTSALLPSRFGHHIFDLHINPTAVTAFKDRTSAQAQAERNAYLNSMGL